jgi:hypothetical protein
LKPARANSFLRPHLEKTHHKKGIVEWLKVKALSSTPSTTKTNNNNNNNNNNNSKSGAGGSSCNPSYSGDRQRSGGLQFEAIPGK